MHECALYLSASVYPRFLSSHSHNYSLESGGNLSALQLLPGVLALQANHPKLTNYTVPRLTFHLTRVCLSLFSFFCQFCIL